MSNDYQIGLKFYHTDKALLDFVKRKATERSEGMATYIKDLIKLEMLRCGEEFIPNEKRTKTNEKKRRVKVIQFSKGEDDVYTWLKSQENVSQYICDLVREDMRND